MILSNDNLRDTGDAIALTFVQTISLSQEDIFGLLPDFPIGVPSPPLSIRARPPARVRARAVRACCLCSIMCCTACVFICMHTAYNVIRKAALRMALVRALVKAADIVKRSRARHQHAGSIVDIFDRAMLELTDEHHMLEEEEAQQHQPQPLHFGRMKAADVAAALAKPKRGSSPQGNRFVRRWGQSKASHGAGGSPGAGAAAAASTGGLDAVVGTSSTTASKLRSVLSKGKADPRTVAEDVGALRANVHQNHRHAMEMHSCAPHLCRHRCESASLRESLVARKRRRLHGLAATR